MFVNFSPLPIASCPVLSQPFLLPQMLQALDEFLSASLNLFHCVHVFLVLGKLQLDPVLEMWFHQHWGEGKDPLPYLLVMLFLIEDIGLPNYLISA